MQKYEKGILGKKKKTSSVINDMKEDDFMTMADEFGKVEMMIWGKGRKNKKEEEVEEGFYFHE